KLNYLNTEMNSYLTEIKKRGIEYKDHWINDVYAELDKCADMIEIYKAAETMKSYASLVHDKDGSQSVASDVSSQASGTEQDKVIAKKSSEAKKNHLEFFVPNADTPKGFDGLGGMSEVKALLTEKILMPLKEPEEAALDLIEYGKKLPLGILFYGPPGCGKSAVIEALAIETDLPLYNLKISKAGSSYINETAANLQEAFEYAKNLAKESGKPVLLRIDELETFSPKRSDSANATEDNKTVGTLLQIMDECRGSNVILLCTSNYYDSLDKALTSRLEDKIYVGLPDVETREKVLSVLLNKRSKGKALANNPTELRRLAEMTDGFSNRNLVQLTEKAAINAKNDGRRDIRVDDYVKPIEENQNMKVNEADFRDKSPGVRNPIGFNTQNKHN
ncbi:MAG: ATP-binding protein, partial [Alphaproteobacteria bacterium]|nr:ATP-binding protein [Alphaproteobacteria bacterium]